jgi:uncharacterized protein YlxW (UPF0749 family)
MYSKFVLTNILYYCVNVCCLLYLQDKTEKALKKEELKKKLPKSSHAPQEEESTHKKELEKARKRIADLETRVDELKAQITMVCKHCISYTPINVLQLHSWLMACPLSYPLPSNLPLA